MYLVGTLGSKQPLAPYYVEEMEPCFFEPCLVSADQYSFLEFLLNLKFTLLLERSSLVYMW